VHKGFLAEQRIETSFTGYLRSVMVIGTASGVADAENSADIVYHFIKLQKQANLQAPTQETRKIADRVVQCLARTSHNTDPPNVIKDMLNLAVQWKDSNMWDKVMNKASSTPAAPSLSELVETIPVFGLDSVNPQ
jgi:hypothetical protein